MIKKIFFALLIILIFSLGLVGIIAAVPHAHGHDLDHSQHKTCPFYQASLHCVDLALFSFFLLFLIFSSLFLSSAHAYFYFPLVHSQKSSRAPPSLLL